MRYHVKPRVSVKPGLDNGPEAAEASRPLEWPKSTYHLYLTHHQKLLSLTRGSVGVGVGVLEGTKELMPLAVDVAGAGHCGGQSRHGGDLDGTLHGAWSSV